MDSRSNVEDSDSSSPLSNYHVRDMRSEGDLESSNTDSPTNELNERPISSNGGNQEQNDIRRRYQPQVLQPDNPLMERFQIALRAHLINQKNKLDEEIIGLEISLKESVKSYENDIELRDLEKQAVLRQNVSLEKERAAAETLIAERENTEASLKIETNTFKETSALLTNKIFKEEELRLEKESLAGLIKQFSEWEQSQNSEITISQRISEKNKTDKNAYTQEKIYQDLLLVKLTSEVLNLSTKFNEQEKNIKQKQSEVETVLQAVADGNADLEALERENKRLMQIWNHVILQIQQRDRILGDIKAQHLTSQEQYSRLVCQIDSYKRSSNGEVKRNETLTGTLIRLQGDIEQLERWYTVEDEKQRKLRENLVQVANMVELTQRDLDNLITDSKEKEAKIKLLQIEIDKLLQTKYQLEEQLLTKLHHQVVLGKAEKQSTKMISNHRNNSRKLETQMAAAQNDLARILLLIEQENKTLKEQTTVLDEEKAADNARDKELQNLEAGLKRLEMLINRKQCQADTLNRKLVDLKSKADGEDLTPDELQIKFLEKAITECTNNIDEQHASWMREQNLIVKMTHQRNSLINQLNIYHKQILVMKQKHLKTEFEIESLKKDEINMKRQMNALEKRLTNLNVQCSERKGYKESLDNQNQMSQNQLICDLKDWEVQALTLQEDMCYSEIGKEELRGQIVQAQRELLAWERKLQMATEIKQNIEKARAEGGEIATMKSEIHRMEVRYAQLQKVQDKLAHDMEMCISRRDGIVDLAQAREKRSTKRALYTRQQFLKKLDDLQSKIKQMNSEFKALEKTCSNSNKELLGLTEREKLKKGQLSEIQEAVSQMQAQLSEGQLHKQKNLELLVRKQRKARQYGEVKAERYNLQFRQESAIELETQKQKGINSDLVSIVESLSTDFPLLQTPVTQILNTLRSPPA